MVLTVHVPSRHLEEDGAVVAVGDHLSTWLEFREGTRGGGPPQEQHRLTGLARPAPAWDGAEWGRHPTIVDHGGALIYWDAPQPVSGLVEVTGVIAANNLDAPDGFPVTAGIVTRVRMEWHDFRSGDDGAWRPIAGSARYEDLPSSYLPRTTPEDPAADATLVVWTGVLVDLDVTGRESSSPVRDV